MKKFELSGNIDGRKVFLMNKNELHKQFAPHFYRSEYADLLRRLKRHVCKKLGEIAVFSDETWKRPDGFGPNFPYIEINGIDTKTGKVKSVREIPVDKAPNRARMLVRKGDILIAKTRPSKAAIAVIGSAHHGHIASTGFSIVRKIRDKRINRDFLYIALRQKFSLMQLKQRSGDRNYAAVSQDDLSNVLIPCLDLTSQQKVVDLVREAYAVKEAKEKRAKGLLASIDAYLVDALGIKLPEPRIGIENRIFQTRYSDIASGRFDANYHQPFFQDSCTAIKRGTFEVRRIKEVAKAVFQGVGRSLTDSRSYVLLKVKNIKADGEIDFENTEYVAYVPDSKVLLEGDIIAPFVGEAVRQHRFSVYYPQRSLRHTVDNNTGVIRLRSDALNPYFAANFLSSSIGKRQVDQHIAGGVIPLLGSYNARRILVPIPPLKRQNEMADHIRQLRLQIKSLRQEGETALEEASLAVERFVLGERLCPTWPAELAPLEGVMRRMG